MRWALVACAVLLCLPLEVGLAPATTPAAPHAANVFTPSNGNFSLRAAGPSGPLLPGDLLRVEYYVALVRSSGPAPLTVTVPPLQIGFATVTGTVAATSSSWNFTFGGALSVSPVQSVTANITLFVLNGSTFNRTNSQVLLSSELVALMTNAPYGDVALRVTWRWLVANPGGATIIAPWASSAPIVPDEFVMLSQAGPSNVVPGGSYTVCVSGDLAGRLFSLHLEIARPYDDFVQVNGSFPGRGGGPLCITAALPAWVPAGPLLAHLWDYQNVSLLLYVTKFTYGGSNSPPAWEAWLTTPRNSVSVLVGVVGVVALIGVARPLLRTAAPPPAPRGRAPPAAPPRTNTSRRSTDEHA